MEGGPKEFPKSPKTGVEENLTDSSPFTAAGKGGCDILNVL